MKMTKKQFRIGELADRLKVKRFVIRFWEKEFELSASRSTGKQRFYNEDDYATFSTIKQLLYNEKFTISGAKKQLAAEKKCLPSPTVRNTHTIHTTDAHTTKILTAEKTTLENHDTEHMNKKITILTTQMLELRAKLIKLNELL